MRRAYPSCYYTDQQLEILEMSKWHLGVKGLYSAVRLSVILLKFFFRIRNEFMLFCTECSVKACSEDARKRRRFCLISYKNVLFSLIASEIFVTIWKHDHGNSLILSAGGVWSVLRSRKRSQKLFFERYDNVIMHGKLKKFVAVDLLRFGSALSPPLWCLLREF